MVYLSSHPISRVSTTFITIIYIKKQPHGEKELESRFQLDTEVEVIKEVDSHLMPRGTRGIRLQSDIGGKLLTKYRLLLESNELKKPFPKTLTISVVVL